MDRGRAEVYQGLSHITVVDSCFFDKFRKLLHAWISNYFFLFFFFSPLFSRYCFVFISSEYISEKYNLNVSLYPLPVYSLPQDS